MFGRDWTHLGVAKLYTDVVANGYNILYLTSRSVGQADTTRGYLNGVVQDGFRLPRGPVIMSPDRTMAALRRELYIRKPEVFKMACLRDIMNLYQPILRGEMNPSNIKAHQRTPFYAGFGNRLTDALSYRSVSIPPTRIFTINSNAEVNLHLLTLNNYRTSYMSIWELVDHYFPPVGLLVREGGEEYTDFNYWRERPLDIDDFSASESEEDDDDADADVYDGRPSIDDAATDMEASYMSRDSIEDPMGESRVLDAVGEADEEGEDLIHAIIMEEPEEAEEGNEDELLVEESEQLDALDLASVKETPYQGNHPQLHRAESSPQRMASS
jgi:phosphatidate phosphatase LPIN